MKMESAIEIFGIVMGIFMGVIILLLSMIYQSLSGIKKDTDYLKGGWNTFLSFMPIAMYAQRIQPYLVSQLRSPVIQTPTSTQIPRGNPYNPARKNYLLDRWQRGNISKTEAEELQRYLQEDATNATGAALAAILLALGLLGLLLFALAVASQK